jgi:hypothetical protein
MCHFGGKITLWNQNTGEYILVECNVRKSLPMFWKNIYLLAAGLNSKASKTPAEAGRIFLFAALFILKMELMCSPET